MDDVLIVRRWQRYGADRLFVTGGTGDPVGSVDLLSGAVAVADDHAEPQVRRAAQAYLRADVAELVHVAPPLPRPHPAPEDRGRRGADLATRLHRWRHRGWQVLDAVPVGRQGSVVEHLAVGPAGVLAVTGLRCGRAVVAGRHLECDGRAVPALRDAALAAGRVRTLLRAAVGAPVPVRALLVVDGVVVVDGAVVPDGIAPVTGEVQRAGSPPDVLVVALRDLAGTLAALPAVLDADRVAAIAAVARRPGTWVA